MQLPFGGIAWSQQGGRRGQRRTALLAGSSSIYHALRAGLALADLVGEPQPGWELAAGRLRHALEAHRDLFLDKATFSMDWYYPVLCGPLRGEPAARLLARRWDDVRRRGARLPLRRHQPVGHRRRDLRAGDGARQRRRPDARAASLLADMQHSRHAERALLDRLRLRRGGVLARRADDVHLGGGDPRRRRAVADHARRPGIFRGDALPADPPSLAVQCGCVATDAAWAGSVSGR